MKLFIVFVFLLIYSLDKCELHRLTHREARKLLKILVAAALLKPPGVGIVPIPLPFPVPFSIESVKPPILHPFPAAHYFGHGHFKYGGGGLHFAASEPFPIVAPFGIFPYLPRHLEPFYDNSKITIMNKSDDKSAKVAQASNAPVVINAKKSSNDDHIKAIKVVRITKKT